jgi:hypothetical protein
MALNWIGIILNFVCGTMVKNGIAAKPSFMMLFGRSPYLITVNRQITIDVQ